MVDIKIETEEINLSNIQFSTTNNTETKKLIDISNSELKDRQLKCQKIQFDLISKQSKEYDTSVANAIRRVAIGDGLLIKRIIPTMVDSDDPFIWESELNIFFESMPIRQDIDENVNFKIEYVNDSAEKYLLTTNIFPKDIKEYVNNFPILFISPGKYVRIEFKIKQKFSFLDGKYNIVHMATSIPLEENNGKYEIAKFDKIQSTESNFKHFRLTIGTNGEIKPRDLLTKIVNNIKERLLYVKSILGQFYFENEINTKNSKNDALTIGILVIRNETYTISKMIIRKVFNMVPDIPFLVDNMPDKTVRNIEIKVKFNCSTDEIKKIFSVAIDDLVKTFISMKIY